ncbi:MAG: CocE/NonD family hydrolase [Pseudonocardiaceae bacterium]|nr:CocE/NonD family hydrolase [Pseudonocardiaceae bacterium]
MFGRVVDSILGLPSRETHPVEVYRDLEIRMPDGAVLLADRHRPRGRGRSAVVLIRTPYGRRSPPAWLWANSFARHGIQVVVQSVRGTFGSGGEFWPFHQETEDGLATLAWLREQPWCDGRVATAGASYVGYTQWALGPYADPPLAAICPAISCADFGSSFYPGGALSLDNALTWAALIGSQEDVALRGLLRYPRQQARTRRSMAHLPLGEADHAAIDKPVRFWQDVTAHAGGEDGFWAPIDHRPALKTLTTPTSMVTGWYDLFIREQLQDFRTLASAGGRVRITVGPWAHNDPGMFKAMVSDQVSWLSAHLLDDTTELFRASVRLYLQHADRWLECDEWPPAEAKPTRLHLHPGGRLRWFAPTTDGAPDMFTYDAADPTPSVGGPLLAGKTKQRDNRVVEARPDVLVYTSDPLERDLDVVGELRACIQLRTDPGNADLFVRLCDVDGRGVSRNVCDGIVRLRPDDTAHAAGRAVEVEMLPTAYRFRRGHRLRIQVAGGAFPRFARNHGTGEPVAGAVSTGRIHHRVFRDQGRPSYLELPVLAG